jgi:uncharacterized protein
MHEIITYSILILTLLIFLIMLGMIGFERWINSYLFMPLKTHVWESNLPHDKLMIDDKISAWHFHNYQNAPTVLFCHGNSGNISHRDYVVKLMNTQHLNLLIFDYSGYGHSKGTPSKEQLLKDGEIAYSYLSTKTDPTNIIVWGESIGGFVAIHIASEFECRRLILLSAFSSLVEVLQDHEYYRYIPFVRMTVGVFDNKEKLSRVKAPIAIIHSHQDKLIPFKSAERLLKVKEDSKLFEISGGHSSPEISIEILRELMHFCDISQKRVSKSEPILEQLKNLQGYHFAK